MRAALTPKQVAQAIDVSEASIKRWCDRGLLKTQKTAGGHRRIEINSVMQYIRQNGHTVRHPEALGLSHDGNGTDIALAVREMQLALESGQEAEFRNASLCLFLSGYSACDLFDYVMTPAMRGIGSSWEHGSIDIYHERRACEIIMRFLHELRTIQPELPADTPLAIGGTLTGDRYQIASTMSELTIREAGLHAENFGTGIPVSSFCAAIRNVHPAMLWISLSYIEDLDALVSQWPELRENAQKHGTSLVIGGRALNETIRAKLAHDAYCKNMRELSAVARALLASRVK